MRSILVVLLGLGVAAGGLLFFLLRDRPHDRETVGRALAAGASRDRAADREKIRALASRVEELTRERDALVSVLRSRGLSPDGNPLPGSGAAAQAPPGEEDAAAPAASAQPAEADRPGTPEARKADPWRSLGERMVEIFRLARNAGDKPTPELMMGVSELMGRIGRLQQELGYEDPGFVTTSPRFLASMAASFLADKGSPLTGDEAQSLEELTASAMERYDRAVQSGDFALGRMDAVIGEVESYRSSVAALLPAGRTQGTPLEGLLARSGGSEGLWPDQSSTGAKDLADAARSIADRWMRRMKLPEAEAAGVRAAARDYVERSQTAKARLGADPSALAPAERAALDHELARLQLEALRRLHDTLPLDEAARSRVRAYRSLDRFELGSSGGWSRSGSFGDFRFTAGTPSGEEANPPRPG